MRSRSHSDLITATGNKLCIKLVFQGVSSKKQTGNAAFLNHETYVRVIRFLDTNGCVKAHSIEGRRNNIVAPPLYYGLELLLFKLKKMTNSNGTAKIESVGSPS